MLLCIIILVSAKFHQIKPQGNFVLLASPQGLSVALCRLSAHPQSLSEAPIVLFAKPQGLSVEQLESVFAQTDTSDRASVISDGKWLEKSLRSTN